MKFKIDPLSTLIIFFWTMLLLHLLIETTALKRRGVDFQPSVPFILFTMLSFVLIIIAIGIAFRQKWARTLYFPVSILLLVLIFFAVIKEGFRFGVNITLIIIHGPLIAVLLYGIYYLNRKDIRREFGIEKDSKTQVYEDNRKVNNSHGNDS